MAVHISIWIVRCKLTATELRYALQRAISSGKSQYRDRVESNYQGSYTMNHVGWTKKHHRLQKTDSDERAYREEVRALTSG